MSDGSHEERLLAGVRLTSTLLKLLLAPDLSRSGKKRVSQITMQPGSVDRSHSGLGASFEA